jgi:hypothetical protein
MVEIIGAYLKAGGKDEWTATSNASMRTADLGPIVDWILPLTCVYRHDREGAHVHERTLKVFGLLNGIENYCVADILVHRQEESHGISVNATFHRTAGRHTSAILPPIGSRSTETAVPDAVPRSPSQRIRRILRPIKAIAKRIFGRA